MNKNCVEEVLKISEYPLIMGQLFQDSPLVAKSRHECRRTER